MHKFILGTVIGQDVISGNTRSSSPGFGKKKKGGVGEV